MLGRHPLQRLLLSVALMVCSCTHRTAEALQFYMIEDCVHPLQAGLNEAQGQTNVPRVPGIAVNVTAAEFYSSFAGIFMLSDGSRIGAPQRERTESLHYMQQLMYMVGVHVNETASSAEEGYAGDILQICGKVSLHGNFLLLDPVACFLILLNASLFSGRMCWTFCCSQLWATSWPVPATPIFHPSQACGRCPALS